jgi:hypothetical protein
MAWRILRDATRDMAWRILRGATRDRAWRPLRRERAQGGEEQQEKSE